MSFPRYPKYKDSGVEWLGEVPEHWSVPQKLRAISSLKGRLGWQGLKADEYQDEGPYVVSSAHFTNHRVHWDRCPHVSEDRYRLDDNIQLATGDVLLMKDGAAMGKLAFVDRLPGPACLNSHLLLFRPIERDVARSYCPKFLFYFMQTAYFQEYIKVNGTGVTFLGISQESIGSYQIIMPDYAEQQTIAVFLDREISKIDALVADQRRLMELLKEKRQAIISHAVTKGLNPHAPMKDSGIEWLGEVPNTWDVLTIKRFATLQRGHDLTDAERTEGKYPVVTSGGITGTHDAYMARGPGVVTGRYGSTGRLFYIEEDFWPHNTALYVSEFHGNYPRFVWYSLQTVDFAAHSAKAAVPGIDRNDIHVLPVAVPPLNEQMAIGSFLDLETMRFDALSRSVQRAIDLLLERRTALISAAVTGQIDVRRLAKRGVEAEPQYG